ncbi:GntR family transcriptional regulator [Halobacillus shinanisalinarum]|uniref:GntR family transcriptional regulator n=1 Tax=Halobacillus shinanisalinarum TaxID=2932258 RepID=A0ABY4GUV4_9BACI|nr:GntR family transcriptional regulator [Halobacillus shinanisalinarum]UOQ91945.1 GntR family transcriptional regulator [Halobacillus shinanisalinarum]
MSHKLDHGSFIPLYHQLKDIIKEKIESGEWAPGEKIPSENEMRNDFEISRNTAKKAIEDLVQEGLLDRKQGRGTFVSKPKLEQSLTGFYTFSKVMAAKGMNPTDVIIDIEIKRVKSSIAKTLQINIKEDVVALRRLRKANNEPIILETSYIPTSLIPGLSREDLEQYSLYDFMEKKYGVTVSKAREVFEPVLIRDYESKYLEVNEGYPALLLDRIAFNKAGRPVEFCRSIVRGDRCRFYTELI